MLDSNTNIFGKKFENAINKVFANFTNSYDFEKQSNMEYFKDHIHL